MSWEHTGFPGRTNSEKSLEVTNVENTNIWETDGEGSERQRERAAREGEHVTCVKRRVDL